MFSVFSELSSHLNSLVDSAPVVSDHHWVRGEDEKF